MRNYLDDNYGAVMTTFNQHVAMQEQTIRKTKMLRIERIHSFLINVLKGRFSVFDGDTDLLVDSEAERFIIYLRVYLWDYLDSKKYK